MAVIHSPNAFMERLNSLCIKLSPTDEQYEELSQQAARELRENRSLYVMKVLALALLGHAYIGLIMVTLVFFALATLWIITSTHFAIAGLKLIFVLLLPLWFITKSFWVKIPEPEGIVVTRKNAPKLFRLLDELSRELKTKVDKVLIDSRFNTGVVQIPRLGMFGFHKNFLVIGMSLMLTQRPEQFKAVLAHEMGHLSSQHSKSSAWIYTLRGQWSKLLNTLNSAGSFVFALFLLFFSWFSPRFSAYSLAMARAHELEADASAVAISGAESFTASMLLLPVYEHFLNEVFWPEIGELVKSDPEPPGDVFFRMQEAVATYEATPETIEKTVIKSFSDKGSGSDSHPPLRVRLLEGHFTPILKIGKNQSIPNLTEALFDEITSTIEAGDSAADLYLGKWLDTVLAQLSDKWKEENHAGWQTSHKFFEDALADLATLERKEATEALTLEERKIRAILINKTQDDNAAIAAYKQILATHPQEATIRFNMGMLLLKKDLDQGLIHVKSAISLQRTLLHQAAPVVIPLLKESGKSTELESFQNQLTEFYKEAELARKERNSVTGESILEPHGLGEEDVECLQNFFSQLPTIHEVYVVRKYVRYLPDCPYLVLGLVMKTKNKGSAGVQESVAMAQAILKHLQLRHEFCVSVFDAYTIKLKSKMVAMDDSLIYKK